jgi:branched-chain amino acid transport system substrate-binding protein
MNTIPRRVLVWTLAVAAGSAVAADPRVVKIGVMNDMSGIYADGGGKGSAAAAQLAVEDFLAANPKANIKVEILLGDHQNKPDVGAAVARKWFEAQGVDAVVDLPNSGVALAVSALAAELNKTVLVSGAGSTRITGDLCNANTVHWVYDTYATAQGSVKAAAGKGRDKWFFITADYSFGHNLEENATAAVKALGYQVVGSARAPLGNSDFSSLLLQAQSAGANVVGFANAGGDFTNAAKQAVEFGLPKQGIALGALWAGITELHTVGLKNGQGLAFMVPFYWDANDKTRAVNARFAKQFPGRVMSEQQSGVYGSTLGFLRGVLKADSTKGKDVVAAMKTLDFDDIYGKGSIRADGRKIHAMSLYTAKSPAESKSEWDLFKLVKTIPGDQAFAPPSPKCPLVK